MSDTDSDEYDPLEVAPVAPVFCRTENHHLTLVSNAETPATFSSLRRNNLASTSPSLGKESGIVEENLVPPGSAATHRLKGPKGRVRTLCLSPRGNLLCAGDDSQLCMWDFERPPENRFVTPTRVLTPFVNRIAGFQPIISLSASLDGSYVVACQDGDRPALVGSGGAQLGFCAMGERGTLDAVKCKGHRAPVTDSSPHATDARKFFTVSQDGTGRMWDSELFTMRSEYSVKHGSGQIDDIVILEAVCGLSGGISGGKGFVTAGVDGRIQLWDTRQAYRPGGASGTWDLYSSVGSVGASSSSLRPPFPGMEEEKHVGGIEEVRGASPGLVVRVGSELRTVDLRVAAANTVISATTPLLSLPHLHSATETSCIVRGATAHSFFTVTSRQGFCHTVGGHVVEVKLAEGKSLDGTAVDGEDQSVSYSSWGAGKSDEDVLCVAVDRSEKVGGSLFAGLSSGEIVVRPAAGSIFSGWWDSRPARPNENRKPGEKHPRSNEDALDFLF